MSSHVCLLCPSTACTTPAGCHVMLQAMTGLQSIHGENRKMSLRACCQAFPWPSESTWQEVATDHDNSSPIICATLLTWHGCMLHHVALFIQTRLRWKLANFLQALPAGSCLCHRLTLVISASPLGCQFTLSMMNLWRTCLFQDSPQTIGLHLNSLTTSNKRLAVPLPHGTEKMPLADLLGLGELPKELISSFLPVNAARFFWRPRNGFVNLFEGVLFWAKRCNTCPRCHGTHERVPKRKWSKRLLVASCQNHLERGPL